MRVAGELQGRLYMDLLGRPEDAVTHFRQAAEIYVKLGDTANEGRVRNNLAELLRRVGRLDEARSEIDRAIRCNQGLGHSVAPWNAWSILCDIETNAGRAAEAARARAHASTAYLEYRRDRGEPQGGGGRLASDVGSLLAAGDASRASVLLQQCAAAPDLAAWQPPMIVALQAVISGDRNPALADAPGLLYDDAAEIRLLIERLNAAEH